MGGGESALERIGCAALISAVFSLGERLPVSGEIIEGQPSASLPSSNYPLKPSAEEVST